MKFYFSKRTIGTKSERKITIKKVKQKNKSKTNEIATSQVETATSILETKTCEFEPLTCNFEIVNCN